MQHATQFLPIIINAFLFQMLYRQIDGQHYAYTYSLFILCTELHAARMQIKSCRSCLHCIKARADLYWAMGHTTEESWFNSNSQ